MKIITKGIKNLVITAFFSSMTSILSISAVNAEIVGHLYEVEVPVISQGRAERKIAIREALKEILVRVSGRNEAGALAEDEAITRNPSGFVQQFRYRKFKSDEVIPAAPQGAKPYKQKLWLRFTEKTIAKFLSEYELPVWGKTRPSTLVWLVVDDQKQRVLIGNSTPHVSRTHIKQEATKKGLPFRLPLLDLADQSKLQVSDVWGNFEDTILAASSRYQAEAILVGRIYMGFSKTWNARWSLYSEGRRQDWDINNSETLRLAVKEGLSKTGEVLSVRFAQVDTSEESNDEILLKINNIANLKIYNKVMKYLKSLSVVTNVKMTQMNTDNVIFSVTSRNGRLGVSQAIDLGHVLVSNISQPEVRTEIEDNKPETLKVDLTYNMVL